jgi:hypothetical protein
MNKTKASVCKGKEYGTFKTVPVNKWTEQIGYVNLIAEKI